MSEQECKEYPCSPLVANVEYAPRGPLLIEAQAMERTGKKIKYLNLGDPAGNGIDAPEEAVAALVENIWSSTAYTPSKGLFAAREAILQYTQDIGIKGVSGEDIIITDGVTGAFFILAHAFISPGMEILMPQPCYPAWNAIVESFGGRVVEYRCDEQSGYLPDTKDIEQKITSQTGFLLLITPNNPTGAIYSQEILEECVRICRMHRLAIVFDEIYSRLLYDGVKHISIASLADDLLIFTMGGIAKNYRLTGFKSGWLIISGSEKRYAAKLIKCINTLAAIRLCANAPGQFVIPTCLHGHQSINDLVVPGGQLYDRRQVAMEELRKIPGVSFVVPQGAFYIWAKFDPEMYYISNDFEFCMQLLRETNVLIVNGTGFHSPNKPPFYARIVFLAPEHVLRDAIRRIGKFLERYNGHRK